MPQRKEITWAQLRVGIMVAASLLVLVVGIFLISGQIGFLTRKYVLKAYLSEAGGLRQGAQVQLAGIPVGSVQAIRISPYSESGRAVEVLMKIARRYQDQIRADSQAATESAGLLGEHYINISRGSSIQPVILDGGEVKSREEKDIKKIVQNADDVISNLRVLSEKLNDITSQITAGRGSIGKLLYEEEFYNRINATTASAQKIVSDVQKGEGTIGKFLVDPTVYQKSVATIDRVNQLMDQIQSGQGSIGRFISDPAVYNELKDAAAKTNKLVDDVNHGKGTLGKLVTDDRLYAKLNDTVEHVDAITARMERGEGTLGKLSTDPSLFNNLSESSKSLREFLTEFRKNPKKYLTLHIRIF